MDRDKQYISLYLDKDMLKQIDEYRFDNRFPSRTEAIRHLVATALPATKKRPKTA